MSLIFAWIWNPIFPAEISDLKYLHVLKKSCRNFCLKKPAKINCLVQKHLYSLWDFNTGICFLPPPGFGWFWLNFGITVKPNQNHFFWLCTKTPGFCLYSTRLKSRLIFFLYVFKRYISSGQKKVKTLRIWTFLR